MTEYTTTFAHLFIIALAFAASAFVDSYSDFMQLGLRPGGGHFAILRIAEHRWGNGKLQTRGPM